jgi:HK97 family phage prohead protease
VPYEVKKSDECPESKPWACLNSESGEVMGCHESQEAAEEQQAALYAQEGNMDKSATRRSTADDRKRAAELRAAKADVTGYMLRSAGPVGTLPDRVKFPNGRARSLAFPGQIRAKLVDFNGQQRYHLRGEATVYNTPYEMWDAFGPYDEIVEHTALDDSLAAEPDVAFLVNHKGVTMARTVNGSLTLTSTKQALETDAYVNPKRTDVKDLVTAIEDGEVTEMSFAFMLNKGWWSDDFTQFRISEADIHRGDVSAVNYGANPYTSIAARQQELLGELDRMGPELARVALTTLLARRELDLDGLFEQYSRLREADIEAREAASDSAATTQEVDAATIGRSISHIEALLVED